MSCSKCGATTSEGVFICQACTDERAGIPSSFSDSEGEVCRLAVWSIVSLLLAPVLLLGGFVLDPQLFILAPLALFVAFVLGIVSMVRISNSKGALGGHGYARIGVYVPTLVFLFGILMPYLARVRSTTRGPYCDINLSGIGKAMLIYANDYDDQLPKAGGRINNWTDSLGGYGNALSWRASNRRDAYAISGGAEGTGQLTVSASLYLLVKYAEVTPRSFLCPAEENMEEFKLSDWSVPPETELIDVWDFGYFVSGQKNQNRHLSYSYHHPFGEFALSVDDEPTMAVMADRSPWCDPNGNWQARWSSFTPDLDVYGGTSAQARQGNSLSHEGKGQNVLFLDSHVSFEKRPFVGIAEDNIYTRQTLEDPEDRAKGQIPVFYDAIASQPRNRRDSVLLQENGTRGEK